MTLAEPTKHVVTCARFNFILIPPRRENQFHQRQRSLPALSVVALPPKRSADGYDTTGRLILSWGRSGAVTARCLAFAFSAGGVTARDREEGKTTTVKLKMSFF